MAIRKVELACDDSLDPRNETMVHKDEPMTIRTNIRNQSQRPLSRWGSASATFFATALAICLVPMGCAASDEYAETPPQPSEQSQPLERTLHSSMVIALQHCVNEGVSRLSRHAYDLTFEIDATAKGAIRGVESKGKRLDDAQMETCLIQALRQIPVSELLPPDDSVLDDSIPASSQRILPPGRVLLGNTAVLPQVIRLAPIVVTASGVTIVVAVVVVVAVAAVVATMSAECVAEWEKAYKYCQEIQDSNDPPHDVTGGYVNTKDCARGHVREACGGNLIDWGGKGARPGRRT